MRKIVWLAYIASLCLRLVASDSFVLGNPDHLIVPKSAGFIQQLSYELKKKTGFSLYVVAVDRIEGSAKEGRESFKQSFLQRLIEPYGVIFFFKEHQKIDIILKPDLGINRGEIISHYMVPILMQEREMPPSKISAAILNGYAQLADEIANHYQINLENNLVVDRSGVQDYVHYLVYAMLGVMFGLIGLIYWTRNKK
ncbi:hypothetical protein [Helicobacter pametensis]|uniref:hypothetical protein n=1 Tax=Helicobacter pametensis TaxID=95149 RepID=UPI0004BAF456|nr:hypothetical protein [Helicobacter pametensis]